MNAELVAAIIAVLSSLIVSLAAWKKWKKFKAKVSQVRTLIDSLDDALYDDKVTQIEFEAIWEQLKSVTGLDKEER